MLESLLKEACALLNVKAEKTTDEADSFHILLETFALKLRLRTEQGEIAASLPLATLSDAQLTQVAEMVLTYNTQSLQSGGMRIGLDKQNQLIMYNDLYAADWPADRLARFFTAFVEVSAAWRKVLTELTSNEANSGQHSAAKDVLMPHSLMGV